MERWLGRVALVTGASAGIGAAITKLLAQQGMKVVTCARRTDRLQSLADEINQNKSEAQVFPITCDVSEEDQVLAMFQQIREKFDHLDVCINNAGIYRGRSLLDGDAKSWKNMLMVNVFGLSICTREAVKLMREKKIDDGQIININSMSGHRVVSNAPSHFYGSTKFAVTALTEGLRKELVELKSNIRVSSISPGMVKTDLFNEAIGNVGDLFKDNVALEPEDVANFVISILQTPPHVQVHDILLRPTGQGP